MVARNDLESGFVNDDDVNGGSSHEDMGGGEIDSAERSARNSSGRQLVLENDSAERSVGNSSSRQLVLEDDELVNMADSEDSQDNISVRRRGSRRRGWGRKAR
ncbi:hypothetical protein DFP73DRAFT_599287 [Morchella snyderi]|nr:hypothetical protein DFP73DRAFT_599287 [Morchella snyderi]